MLPVSPLPTDLMGNKLFSWLTAREISKLSTDLHYNLSLPVSCISRNSTCVPQGQFPLKV